jgi:rhodanese-related sulfurtransferase
MATYFDCNQLDVLDVRKTSEFNAEHLVCADNFPLDFINQKMNQLDRNKKYYLYCNTGFRSVIAASILKARGYSDVVNIPGGWEELVETSIPRTEFVEQITEL